MFNTETTFREVETQYPIDESLDIVVGYPQKNFIYDYLYEYDNDFYEPLSTRVDFGAYSQKLTDLSTTFVIFKNEVVAGLICSYFYQPESGTGFITLVHTKREYRGQHLSVHLLTSVQNYASKHGFRNLELYVSKQQKSAYNLYIRHGFNVISEEANGRCRMKCVLSISK